MTTGELPSNKDAFGLASKMKQLFGAEGFLLFPLDWGAARVADLLDQEKTSAGISYIRRDLSISSDSLGHYRPVLETGKTVRKELERGQAKINTTNGPVYRNIDKVNFGIQRNAVFLEDWIGYTGQGLQGGSVWGIDNTRRLNLKKIYVAAMKAFREFELPKGYEHFASIMGGLILPYDRYPVGEYQRAMTG